MNEWPGLTPYRSLKHSKTYECASPSPVRAEAGRPVSAQGHERGAEGRLPCWGCQTPSFELQMFSTQEEVARTEQLAAAASTHPRGGYRELHHIYKWTSGLWSACSPLSLHTLKGLEGKGFTGGRNGTDKGVSTEHSGLYSPSVSSSYKSTRPVPSIFHRRNQRQKWSNKGSKCQDSHPNNQLQSLIFTNVLPYLPGTLWASGQIKGHLPKLHKFRPKFRVKCLSQQNQYLLHCGQGLALWRTKRKWYQKPAAQT